MFNFGSSPTVTSCTFINNSSYYYGGGIGNYEVTRPVTKCTFVDDDAAYGGGMFKIEIVVADP